MRLTILPVVIAVSVAGCAANGGGAVTAVPETVKAATDRNGLTEERAFASAILGRDARYHLYLPPGYDEDADDQYEVVYWLHGSGGYPPGAVQMLAKRFDTAMRSGRIPPAIVVFPDGFANSMWINARTGARVEDMIVRELVPHIDASYATLASREGRTVEGGSMGGYGAARLGFVYPELFSAVSSINPGPMQRRMDVEDAPIVGRSGALEIFETVYGGDQAYFEAQSPWRLARSYTARRGPPLAVRLIFGEQDPITPVNRRYAAHLDALGIQHELIVVEGAGHDPRAMFAGMGDTYWTFFAEMLGDGTAAP